MHAQHHLLKRGHNFTSPHRFRIVVVITKTKEVTLHGIFGVFRGGAMLHALDFKQNKKTKNRKKINP